MEEKKTAKGKKACCQEKERNSQSPEGKLSLCKLQKSIRVSVPGDQDHAMR